MPKIIAGGPSPEGRGRRDLRHALGIQGRRGLWLLAGVLLLCLPTLGGSAWRDALRYDRTALHAGELWRLVTAHAVHLDTAHALLNAGGLVLLWILFSDGVGKARLWCLAAVLSIIAIDAGLWWLSPEVSWYVGASGLLHGFMAAGTVEMLRRHDPIALPMALIFVAKLAWELFHGPLPFETQGTVITAAHCYGALGGAVAAILRGR